MVLAPSSGEMAPSGLVTLNTARKSPPAMIAEASGDKAGMQGVGSDARRRAPRQFAVEQDVGQLGPRIDRKARITLLGLKVAEIQFRATMGI